MEKKEREDKEEDKVDIKDENKDSEGVVEVKYEEVCTIPIKSGIEHTVMLIKPVNTEKDKNNDRGADLSGSNSDLSNENGSQSPRIKLSRKITTKRRR